MNTQGESQLYNSKHASLPPPRPAQLTQRNLERFNQIAQDSKPSHSQFPPTSKSTTSTMQSSASFNAVYSNLESAGIHIVPIPTPTQIRSQLDVIFGRPLSEERKEEIVKIAANAYERYTYIGRTAREDDWVELIVRALEEMNSDKVFAFARKGEFSSSLRPIFPQESQSDNRDILDPLPPQPSEPQPPLRRSARLHCPSLPPQPIHGPPPTPSPQSTELSLKGGTRVPAPRPDVTVGIHYYAIVQALVQRGLKERDVKRFLGKLQDRKELCFDPFEAACMNLRYPFLVIEGKAFSAEGGLGTAYCQAALAGCYMVNHQRQLTEAFQDVFLVPGDGETPLAFSIPFKGYNHELWVHYHDPSTEAPDTHEYYMNYVQGYSVMRMAEFLMELDRLMAWYRDTVLPKVTDHLFQAIRRR